MRYLGIDYGTKKTGIALSDESGAMGFPHSARPTDARLLDEVISIIKQKQVGAVVFGESTDFEGNRNAVASAALAFAENLHGRTGIDIYFESEAFTTQAARRFPDGTRMEGSPDVDASAAALILTSFLEREGAARSAPTHTQETKEEEVLIELPVTEDEVVTSVEESPEETPTHISIGDFAKVHVSVGTVLSAERVPETDKLLRLMVDLGEGAPRQIVSGIAAYTEPEALVGKQLSFVTNLAPRKIKGLESNGMLFAVGEGDSFAFMVPDRHVPPGTGAH